MPLFCLRTSDAFCSWATDCFLLLTNSTPIIGPDNQSGCLPSFMRTYISKLGMFQLFYSTIVSTFGKLFNLGMFQFILPDYCINFGKLSPLSNTLICFSSALLKWRKAHTDFCGERGYNRDSLRSPKRPYNRPAW